MKSIKKTLSKPLDQSRIFYQTFLNSSNAILICDPAANTLFTNPAYTKLYGFSEEELMGKKSGLIRHKDTPKEIYQEMWAAITDPKKGVWQGELRNRKKDGTPVEVELTVKTIFDENQEIIAYMSVAVDISEKKQIEKKLIEQEKLYSIGLLSSGIAHVIGSPLNVISGRAEMIKEGGYEGGPV